MFNITLLSSFHKIYGKCNPHELYKIIQEIEPEIIFEELSNDGFDMIYSVGYQPQSVEAITITYYLKTHLIKHFPIDNYPIKETDLLSDAQIKWDTSSEYRNLWNQKLLRVNQEGYVFFNSKVCTEMLDRMSTIEEAVLTEINDFTLLNQHKAEKALHDKREYVMLSNIYNISKQHPFKKALFICGAEHRQPIREKIKEFESKEKLKLEWTFYNDN